VTQRPITCILQVNQSNCAILLYATCFFIVPSESESGVYHSQFQPNKAHSLCVFGMGLI